MNYYELQIETAGPGVELVENELTELGITQFVVDDPNLDIQMMDEAWGTEYVDREEILARKDRSATVTVYTETLEEAESIRRKLQDWMPAVRNRLASGVYGENLNGDSLGSGKIRLTLRGDEEWKDKWKAYFKPTKITEHIVVCPSWEEYEPASDEEVVISIDPGMAFGTGTHETTALTTLLMEKYLKPGEKMLDVGCGSGILSIIAARLGASRVLGIDIDDEAVTASEENGELNGVMDIARFQIGDLTEGVDFQADVVVANLLTHLVLRLSPDIPKHMLPGGRYVTSGILVEQEASVVQALEELGFTVLETAEKGDWCCIAARL
ncbi:MAG: 50S ribosomal protein L11 methyltransferase [Clostridia bacterium]